MTLVAFVHPCPQAARLRDRPVEGAAIGDNEGAEREDGDEQLQHRADYTRVRGGAAIAPAYHRRMRIVVAPQEMKGSLTAVEAAGAIAAGLRRAIPGVALDLAPMADGGPGTVEALLSATKGVRQVTRVDGPLGEPVDAAWAVLSGGTAVVEMAAASGLALVPEGRRDAARATTRGCGQLLRAVLAAGHRDIVFGMGGSATVDGGAGLGQALGFRLLDDDGRDLPPGGLALRRLARIDASGALPVLAAARIVVACDVDAPLVGERGAAAVFAPQKGASPGQVSMLAAGLARLAGVVRRDLGAQVAALPGGGAAGGLAAGLVAFAGGELRPGGPIVAEALGLAERLRHASICVTGEGAVDAQTAMGKAVAVVAAMSRAAGVPCYALTGRVEPGAAEALGLTAARAIAPEGMAWDEARRRAAELLTAAAEALGRELAPSRQRRRR